MIQFDAYPTYDKYRSLRLTTPHQFGQDVYALQSALLALGFGLPQFGADGDLGKETSDAISAAQRRHGLAVDGVAGGLTQRALALELVVAVQDQYVLPAGLLKGQVEHESSYRLGIYSGQYANGSFDAGVAQRNTNITPAQEGFSPKASVAALGARVRRYHGYFAGVADARRRWQLAQGSWNAPAWACWLAKSEGARAVPTGELPRTAPSAEHLAQLERYMQSVSAYLTV